MYIFFTVQVELHLPNSTNTNSLDYNITCEGLSIDTSDILVNIQLLLLEDLISNTSVSCFSHYLNFTSLIPSNTYVVKLYITTQHEERCEVDSNEAISFRVLPRSTSLVENAVIIICTIPILIVVFSLCIIHCIIQVSITKHFNVNIFCSAIINFSLFQYFKELSCCQVLKCMISIKH